MHSQKVCQLPPSPLIFFWVLDRQEERGAFTHHSAKGETVADGLSKSDDVRHNALFLERPEVVTCTAEAALHLVCHAHGALCVHLLVHFSEIALRQDDLRKYTPF